MNVEDGRLMRLAADVTPPEGFLQVPEQFEAEAEECLADAEAKGIPAICNLESDTPMTRWARETYKQKKKKKSRARMAKVSKKANRRKI